MADLGAGNWNESDSGNNTAAPDGAPEGMAPSGVNDVLRAVMGAQKRFYNWQSTKQTAGSATAYTLSYGVAPGALVDGMTHLVEFHAANGNAATLNVNSLGAKPLHHDESMHAYFSLLFAQHPETYAYDPLLHGPFQFHAGGLRSRRHGGLLNSRSTSFLYTCSPKLCRVVQWLTVYKGIHTKSNGTCNPCPSSLDAHCRPHLRFATCCKDAIWSA